MARDFRVSRILKLKTMESMVDEMRSKERRKLIKKKEKAVRSMD